MIPSPVLQLTSPAAAPGAVLPGDLADPAQSADFAALLAQSAVPAAMPVAAEAVSTVVDPALLSPAPGAAEPAIPSADPAPGPATSGKILPAELPLAAPRNGAEADTPEIDPKDPKQFHDQRPAHLLPLTAQAGKSRAAALRAEVGDRAPAKHAEPEPVQIEAAVEPAQALALTPAMSEAAKPVLAALVQVPAAAVPAAPSESAASADPVLAQTVPLTAVTPVVDSLAGQAQPRLVKVPQAARPQGPDAQTAAPAAALPAPPPLTQVRLDVPMPEALRPARSDAVRAAPLLASTLGEERDVPAQTVASPAAAVASPAAFTPAIPATQHSPHDFSALIDRLAAAREAAAPQSVSISLPHADFGRVQLHFRSDDGALAVSLASADPDFARIAAQAAPPVLAVGESRGAEHSPGQHSTRSDGQSASASQQGSQRSHGDERRGERQARFDHLPRPASADKGRGRSGIFA